MLLLGRLDGRLQNSPWADIWLARARLQGAAQLAGLAGVPIDVRHLQDWICGRCERTKNTASDTPRQFT
ncbi:hypothetical protein SBA_pBAR4_0170 (plasmid) [Sphingomonas bisphenolicum]|uniref:Uncharacterized protein n=1 Tax=Sphingomonas bisphenolicum TaxID=296544 RepID=A0ABM7G6G2_9SPHN|nr:hypothetical protein SBA_pBAR4_0170 [Sphingomonas bisphenolicum]